MPEYLKYAPARESPTINSRAINLICCNFRGTNQHRSAGRFASIIKRTAVHKAERPVTFVTLNQPTGAIFYSICSVWNFLDFALMFIKIGEMKNISLSFVDPSANHVSFPIGDMRQKSTNDILHDFLDDSRDLVACVWHTCVALGDFDSEFAQLRDLFDILFVCVCSHVHRNSEFTNLSPRVHR